MRTNVNATRIEDFFCGKYYVGMKKEDAEKLKGNIFENPKKEFGRIDKDGNGVIDAKELSAKIRQSSKDSAWTAVLGGVLTVCNIVSVFTDKKAGRKVFDGILTAAFTGMTISKAKESAELKQKANELDALIQQEEAKEAA